MCELYFVRLCIRSLLFCTLWIFTVIHFARKSEAVTLRQMSSTSLGSFSFKIVPVESTPRHLWLDTSRHLHLCLGQPLFLVGSGLSGDVLLLESWVKPPWITFCFSNQIKPTMSSNCAALWSIVACFRSCFWFSCLWTDCVTPALINISSRQFILKRSEP